jgi:hypothetical protein
MRGVLIWPPNRLARGERCAGIRVARVVRRVPLPTATLILESLSIRRSFVAYGAE